MSRSRKRKSKSSTKRVGIYTRKSTHEGLDQEFNTLDAQRQAIEAFVESQRGEGWVALPERYDDGGYTGANTDRPAFQRLLYDIKDGKIDIVAVYKIDRLSRSLVDFARIIELFEGNEVEFVSVTQQFSTANSMGKLTLNILMSFAEFERQVISERTSDKMGATRKKGMWCGGRPVLGYDVEGKKLVVNEEEAALVRKIHELYLELGSILTVVTELNRKGYKTKSHTSKTGKVTPGGKFNKINLQRILTNPTYIGMVEYRDNLYDGVHEPIIDVKTWKAVQAQLESHRQKASTHIRNKWGMLLRGLIRCGVCGRPYGHHYSNDKNHRYHYYKCQSIMREGAAACPGSSVPARKMEQFVIEQIQAIGRDEELIKTTVKVIRQGLKEKKPELRAEKKRLVTEIRKLKAGRKRLVDALTEANGSSKSLLNRLGEIDDELDKYKGLLQVVEQDMEALTSSEVDDGEVRKAFEAFVPVWSELFPREQERILKLLIEEIVYSAPTGEMEISFRAGGIKALATEMEEAVAYVN